MHSKLKPSVARNSIKSFCAQKRSKVVIFKKRMAFHYIHQIAILRLTEQPPKYNILDLKIQIFVRFWIFWPFWKAKHISDAMAPFLKYFDDF